MFRLASLFVEIGVNTTSVYAGLAGLQARLLGMGSLGQAAAGGVHSLTMGFHALHGVIGTVGIMAGVALGGALVAGLAHCAMEAAHLVEAVAKVEQVFGTASPKILAMADELTVKFGGLRKELLDVAATFGLMLQGAGVGREISAEMSVELSKRSVDISSIWDIPMEEVIQRMQSGLAGEMEAVRRLGVNLTETNVKRQAAAMGFGTGELDQETKTLLRYHIMLKDTAVAAGDAERSQYRMVGQWKLFTSQLTELKNMIGASLVPGLTIVLNLTTLVMGAFNKMLKGILEKVVLTAMLFDEIFGTDVAGKKARDKTLMEADEREKRIAEDRAKDAEEAKKAGAKTPKGWEGGIPEFAKRVQESAWGGGKSHVAEDTLKSAKATEKLLAEIRDTLKKTPPSEPPKKDWF